MIDVRISGGTRLTGGQWVPEGSKRQKEFAGLVYESVGLNQGQYKYPLQ